MSDRVIDWGGDSATTSAVAPDPVGAAMQSFSAFSCDNTEIAACQLFWRFGLIFGSDTKLIDPSFCIAQDSLMPNPLAKFQRFWLRQYRDRRLSVILVIWARIRV